MIKKINKIIYINSFSQGAHHEMYNSSLLLMCSNISEEVICYSASDAYFNYLKLLGNRKIENIKFKRLLGLKGTSKIIGFLTYILSAIQNVFICLFSSKEDLFIYNFNNVFSIGFLDLISRIRKTKIIICCHGELESLIKEDIQYRLLVKILRFLAIQYFVKREKKSSKNIVFILMGESILKNIQKHVLPKYFNFRIIDHPYIFDEINSKIVSDVNSKLHIGTIGTLSNLKGLNSLMELSESLDIINNNDFEISVIGSSFSLNKSLLTENGIKFPYSGNDYCPRELYNRYISSLDLIIFLYPMDSYKMTASGAIYDAINMEKPIVALKNDYFQYLFDKFGSFGYLVNSIKEMKEMILLISSRKDMLIFDFKHLKEKISPDFLQLELNAILRE